MGDSIDAFVKALGPWSRKREFLTGYPFFADRDTVFVWDSQGISVTCKGRYDFEVREVKIFFVTPQNAGADTARMHYFVEAAEWRERLKNNPIVTDELINFGWQLDSVDKAENRAYLEQMQRDNVEAWWHYPTQARKDTVWVNGLRVIAGLTLAEENSVIHYTDQLLWALLVKLPMDADAAFKGLSNKNPFAHLPGYGSTVGDEDGLYTTDAQYRSRPAIRVSKEKMEFILLQGKPCHE